MINYACEDEAYLVDTFLLIDFTVRFIYEEFCLVIVFVNILYVSIGNMESFNWICGLEEFDNGKLINDVLESHTFIKVSITRNAYI